MSNFRLFGTLVTSAVAITFIAASTRADIVVTATFDNSQPSADSVSVASDYLDSPSGNSTTGAVSTIAGIYKFDVTSITGTAVLYGNSLTAAGVANALGNGVTVNGGVFGAVCIDFTHNIKYRESDSRTLKELAGMTSAVNGVGNNSNQANANGFLWYAFGTPLISTLSTPNQAQEDSAAAFQMDVWDIIYDGGGTTFSTVSPTPNVTYSNLDPKELSNFQTTAQTEALAAVSAVDSGYTNKNVYALVDTNNVQNFDIAFTSAGSNPTPLPAVASTGMALFGLLGAGLLGRKLSRRNPLSA